MSQSASSQRILRAMQQRLLRTFREDFTIPPKRLIVGFSGGSDSLVLALLLKQIRGAIPSQIELVHVDHHLRLDSTEDAEASEALAITLELPFQLREIQVDVQRLHHGVGIEEAARRERYLMLRESCEDEDVVVLGHHVQDQAETILMHLMRGAGLQGAAGMTRLSSIEVPWWGSAAPANAMLVWRPLLSEDRDKMRTIPSSFGLLPVEDPSNASETYRRNALRHRVIPELREIEPGAIEAIGRFGQIALEEDRFLTRLASQQRAMVSDKEDGMLVKVLLGLDIALRRRIVHQWLDERIGEPPTFERVTGVLGLADSGNESAVLEIAGDQVVGIFRNSLRCGTRSSLEERARQDAGLTLPLWDPTYSSSHCYSEIVVRNNNDGGNNVAIPSPPQPFKRIGLRLVGDEQIEGAGIHSGEWMRRAKISPWIRDRLTGIAIDDRMWWIPRISDDYSEVEPMYVRWIAEEIN